MEDHSHEHCEHHKNNNVKEDDKHKYHDHHYHHHHDSLHQNSHHHGEFTEEQIKIFVKFYENRTFLPGYELVLMSKITEAESILEVGCGSGKIALEMALQKKEECCLTATDVSELMIKITQSRFERFNFLKNVKIEKADGNKLVYPNESFDRFLSNLTIHHVENVENFTREAFRVLKHNGICAISDFGRDENIDSVVIVRNALQRAELDSSKLDKIFPFLRLNRNLDYFRKLFMDAGFSKVRCYYSTMIEPSFSIEESLTMHKKKISAIYGEENYEIVLKYAIEEADKIMEKRTVMKNESLILIAIK